jgi:hypothetical protein
MFEYGTLLAVSMNGREILLVARDGWHIPNSIEADPSDRAVKSALFFGDRLLLSQVAQLMPPTGRYNCHGLVFASRRTNIPPVDKAVSIDELLHRDGYQRANGAPQVGDIAAYRDDRGEIEHTGFVCAVDRIGDQLVPFVWSMWGGLGEFRHRADLTPYSKKIEYWRLK